jgi:Domain of unknown function (DUF4383)
VSAPTFALLIGVIYVVASAIGFSGAFPVTELLSGLYLVAGLWGCAAWAGATSAVRYARSIAILFSVLALLGLVPALGGFFRLMPLGGQDVWLHAVSAMIATYFGFRSLARRAQKVERRSKSPADRRQSLRVVAYERRTGSLERRRDPYGGRPLAAG